MSSKAVRQSSQATSALSSGVDTSRKKSPRSSDAGRDRQETGTGPQETGSTGPKKGVKLPPTERKASTNRALMKLRGSVHTLQVLSRLSKYNVN